MSPISISCLLTRVARKNLRRFGSYQSPLLLVAAILVCEVCARQLFAEEVSLAATGKKLIEYGWDVPTPAQMHDELATMEKRPFEGLIFRLSAGHNAFLTKPLDPAKFAEDERILRDLQFAKFR